MSSNPGPYSTYSTLQYYKSREKPEFVLQVNLVPWPTPFFLCFSLRWRMRKSSAEKNGEGLVLSITWLMWGGGGEVAQPQISIVQQSCVDRLGVLTSRRAFEPSQQLVDELLQDLLKRLWAPPPLRPPRVYLTSLTWWTIPGLPRSLLLFRICVLLLLQTEWQKEQGRPGNKANYKSCEKSVSALQVTREIHIMHYNSRALQRHAANL